MDVNVHFVCSQTIPLKQGELHHLRLQPASANSRHKDRNELKKCSKTSVYPFPGEPNTSLIQDVFQLVLKPSNLYQIISKLLALNTNTGSLHKELL